MDSFWNLGQKKLVGSAFIPENKPPICFGKAPFPSFFQFEGNAYRKVSETLAIKIDSELECSFNPGDLVYTQTNIKSQWQHKQLSNPRNAGRKPTGIVTTTTKVTVPEELIEEWDSLPNKAAFAREAVAEKLRVNKLG
ncbi:MAG: hypothetical protein AAGA46_00605 [Cyanobacteria bacterium P01_F01_bin.13]